MQNKSFIRRWANALVTFHKEYIMPFRYHYGAIGKDSYIRTPAHIDGAENIFLGDNVRIKSGSTILTVGDGRLIIKDNVGCAKGMTVVASNHRQRVGVNRTGLNDDNEYADVIIEDDAWIGANVTLLAGTHIGRGAIIGAGCVVRRQIIPPYAVVIGNPAKIIRFKFTPEECIEHEKQLYPEKERIEISEFRKNYDEFYLSRKDKIKEYKSLGL